MDGDIQWRWRRLGAAFVLTAVVVNTAACTSGPAVESSNSRPTPTDQFSPTTSTMTPTPLPPDGLINLTEQCVRSGRLDLSQQANVRGQYRACVGAGVTLDLDLGRLSYGVWQPLKASNAAVTIDQDVTSAKLVAHIVAARPGVTVISTHTTVVGDPSGPPSVEWILTLTVQP
jgi:hypothetical protein